MTHLVFSQAPTASAHLVFGEGDEAAGTVLGLVTGAFPGLTLQARVVLPNDGTVAGAFPGLTLTATLQYDSNVSRPLVSARRLPHQVAKAATAGAQHHDRLGVAARAGAQHFSQPGLPVAGTAAFGSDSATRVPPAPRSAGHEAAAPLRAGSRHPQGDALRGARLSHRDSHSQAVRRRSQWHDAWQERYRDRRPSRLSRAQTAQPVPLGVFHPFGRAAAVRRHLSGRYQAAVRPPAGQYVLPPIPGPDPCYLPDPHLVFSVAREGPHLVFVCERHDPAPPSAMLLIPLRSLYMISNNISLVRVSDGQPVPASSASVSLDVDSWSWGFNASIPGAALPLVDAGTDEPIELLLTINGMSFRVRAEENARDRTFGRSDLKIRGRGRNAMLDDAMAARAYTNAVGLTAQQLAEDALTLNGVSIGWTVDWGLTDWFVPAGAWSAQGTPMGALLQIAAAAGGYVQPHFTDASVAVLPRYPALPRDWTGLAPDVELPSSVVTVEGIRWERRPDYNRVYVAGADVGGVMGQVTIAGTAGDLAAQMVVDPLITHVDAARQRGLSVLGAAGRKAHVRLRVPALPELGFVRPGQFVRYVDGGSTRLGLVRSAQLDAQFSTVWQTLGIETHVV